MESSNNGILGFKKVLINCQNPSVLYWQLIKILLMSFLVILKFWSTAKIRQFFFGSWSNFLINWKLSKNLVNWLWKFRSTDKTQFWSTEFWSSEFWSSDHSPYSRRQNFENIFKKFENPCINQMITLSVVNNRNQNFGR
jgi:hypothetical protein